MRSTTTTLIAAVLVPATAPGSRCAQDEWLGSPASDAEDCLYLNVTAPAKSTANLGARLRVR